MSGYLDQGMKRTPEDASYYDGTGAYGVEYSKMYDKLVPRRGTAKTLHGELLRIVSNHYIEFLFDGNEQLYKTATSAVKCKVCDGHGSVDDKLCENCDGDGYTIEKTGDAVLTDACEIELKFIEETLADIPESKETVDKIKQCILDMGNKKKVSHIQKYYELLVDLTMYYVLTTEDKDI